MTTFGALITTVRNRVDIENSAHITDTEIGDMLMDSLRKTYNLLIKSGELWNVKVLSFSITNGASYELPSDFYKLEKVDRVISSTNRYTLLRANRRDISHLSYATDYISNRPTRYFIQGSGLSSDGYYTMSIFPPSNANGDYELWYYESLPAYVSGSNVIMGPPDSPWLELAVLDTAIKICAKDEIDPSLFMAQKAEMEKRVEEESAALDMGQNEPPNYSIPWWNK